MTFIFQLSIMAQITLYGGVSLAFVPFVTSIGFIGCLQVIGLFKDVTSLLPCINLENFIEDPTMFLSLLAAFALLSTLIHASSRLKQAIS